MADDGRMNWTMERLAKMSEQEYSAFMRVLFGLSSPSPVPVDLEKDPDVGDIEWVDPTLNESQKEAIRFALASKEIALIHGPPGVRYPTRPTYTTRVDADDHGRPARRTR